MLSSLIECFFSAASGLREACRLQLLLFRLSLDPTVLVTCKQIKHFRRYFSRKWHRMTLTQSGTSADLRRVKAIHILIFKSSNTESSRTSTSLRLFKTCAIIRYTMFSMFLTWTCITLARMAASCSWVGQPMMVCWSGLYSALRVETRLTNTVRMLDRTWNSVRWHENSW